jgi:uncharacterized membrane protein HdeD (DUF308 family)
MRKACWFNEVKTKDRVRKETAIMERTLFTAMSDRIVNQLWWTNMIEATLALFFGVSAVFWPQLTLVTLVYLFSGFVLGLGIVQLFSGIMSMRARSTWWVTLLLGILGIGVGIYLVRHPNVSFQSFVLVVGLLLLARGLLDLVRVFTDRASTRGGIPKILTAIIGVLAIIAGILVMVQPVAGGIAFVWALGVYAIIFGALTMAIAMELRAALFNEAVEESADTVRAESERYRNKAAESAAPRNRKKPGAQPA